MQNTRHLPSHISSLSYSTPLSSHLLVFQITPYSPAPRRHRPYNPLYLLNPLCSRRAFLAHHSQLSTLPIISLPKPQSTQSSHIINYDQGTNSFKEDIYCNNNTVYVNDLYPRTHSTSFREIRPPSIKRSRKFMSKEKVDVSANSAIMRSTRRQKTSCWKWKNTKMNSRRNAEHDTSITPPRLPFWRL